LKITGNEIDFRSDGIRFEKLCRTYLNGKYFGFNLIGIDPNKVRVSMDGKELSFEFRVETKKVFSILF
jgi:hypothetical protein